MKKRYLFLGVIVSSLFLFSIFSQHKVKAPNNEQQKSSMRSRNVPREKQTDAVRRNRVKELVHMASKNSGTAEIDLEDIDMELPEIPSPALTEEQKERMMKMAKVKHLYWEKGHEVLEEILDAQEKNLTWKERILESASKMLGSDAFVGTDLKNVDCGTTLCKIEFHHRSEDAFKSFDDSGGTNNQDWQGNDFGVIRRLGSSDDAPVETTIYFAEDNRPYEEMLNRLVEIAENNEA